MKKLYLLRHAQSSHPRGVDDKDRPLNERGKQECKAMNDYFRQNNINPDVVLSSDAMRTKSTAQEVCAGINTEIVFIKKLYLATAGEIIKEIAKLDEKVGAVMLVAHNPGIHEFALILSDDNNKKHFAGAAEYPTCALAEFLVNIEFWQDIEPGKGILQSLVGS